VGCGVLIGLGVDGAVLCGCGMVGLEMVCLRFLRFGLVVDGVVGSDVRCAVGIFLFLFCKYENVCGERHC